MEWHPLSKRYRMMTKPEMNELVADILKNGLVDPVVTLDDMVLDGRNRLLACEEAGVTPRFVKYEGDDPAGFVHSKNHTRRHLTLEERMNDVRDRLKAEPDKSNRQVAEETKTRPETVQKEREKLEGEGEIPQTKTRISSDGKVKKVKPSIELNRTIDCQNDADKNEEKLPESKAETHKEQEEPTDPLKAAADEFSAKVNGICRTLDALIRDVESLKTPLGYLIHFPTVIDNLRASRKNLHGGRPTHKCAYCDGTGKKRMDKCKPCNGTGYVDSSKRRSGCEAMGIPYKEDDA